MHKVDYIERGEGNTVILLHSTAAGNKQWRKLIDTLSPVLSDKRAQASVFILRLYFMRSLRSATRLERRHGLV